MDEKLKAVAVQLVRAAVESNLSKNINCSVEVSSGYLMYLEFAINMWGYDDGKIKVIKRKRYNFRSFDTDLEIARKMVEITNIMNGEIDPFEEANDDNNKQV